MPTRGATIRIIVLILSLALAACGGGDADGGGDNGNATAGTTPKDRQGPDTPGDVATDGKILLAAGDIADCESNGDEQTARLARLLPGAQVAALGDLAYPSGTAEDFANCWEPSWGRLGNRVRPAPGNHEYGTGVADDYFRYFGPRAGPPGKGWYSYEIGDWHIIALNSNCDVVPVCFKGTEQERWLRADLKAHPKRCTLAYWHHPRYSSGFHGNNPDVEPLREALVAAHADITLHGHDHHYERFAPRDGIREWVVGTGGKANYPVPGAEKGSEVRWGGGHGLLALTLRPNGYEWRFLPSGGADFADSGRGRCA